MIDFDALVLGPTHAIFSRPVTVTPIKSRGNGAPYNTQGIFKKTPKPFIGEDGEIVDADMLTIAFRVVTLPPGGSPTTGDRIYIPAYLSYPAEGDFWLWSNDENTPGGIELIFPLKSGRPPL